MKGSFIFVAIVLFLQKIAGQANPCKLPSCVNGQAQIVNGSGCTCVCDKTWAGPNCDVENICEMDNPCHHSGQCNLRPDGQYYCDCVLGYMAPNCIDRDPCALKEDHCLNGATCHRLDDIDFTCACAIPYQGDHCETKNLCNLDIEQCLDTGTDWDIIEPQCFPCTQHIVPGGCIFHDDTHEYECICLDGYVGDICEPETKERSKTWFNTTMTLPILSLEDMLPHNFIVHRLNITQGMTVVLAIDAPPDFTFHISARQKYRPVCEDIMTSWNTTIPTYKNRIYIILTENLTRPFDDDDTFYVQLWPESSVTGSARPVEVTFDYGFFQMICIKREGLEVGSKILDYVISFIGDCFTRVADDDRELILCDCKTLPFGALHSKYLKLIEYQVEVFMPVKVFDGYEECRIIPWVVLSCSLFYLLVLAILCCSDCRNRKRPNLIVMTKIELIEEQTFYLMTVETGNDTLSSSSANICCQLYGSCCHTKPLVLKDNRLLHTTKQDEEDNYLFSTEQDLGEVTKIRIWHDNSGDFPDWYCRKVIVKNIKSGQSWYFFVREWISVKHQTMISSRDAATPDQLVRHHKGNFRKVFSYQFRDHHIVLCSLLCPPRSFYLRSERWTVLFTVIFIYFILLIFFYGMPSKVLPGFVMEYDAENIIQDNVILYGLYTALIGLPVGIFLDQMFRLVRRQRRIPTLLVCKHENGHVPPRPPQPVPLEYNRFNNLDPDRVMVEAVRREEYVIEPLGPLHETSLETQSDSLDTLRFQIPSTSVSRTETWIGRVLTEGSSVPVQTLPPPPATPAYKKVLNDGVVGAVTSFKEENPLRLVYKPNDVDHVDDTIAKDIRSSFGGGPIWPMTPSRRSSPMNTTGMISSDQGVQDLDPKKRGPLMVSTEVQTTFAYDDPAALKKLKEDEERRIKELRRPYVELCEVAYRGHRCKCPKWFAYVLWVLCICIMIICGTVTIIYGLSYGYIRSLNWCFSLFWAALFAFVGLEMIRLLLRTLHILCIQLKRKNAEYYDERKARERFQLMWFVGTCKFLPKWPLNYILFFPTVIYEPLSSYRMFYLLMEDKKRRRICKNLVDMTFFIVLTICLILTSILVRNVEHFYSGDNVEEIFKVHTDEAAWENSFRSINDPAGFYKYMDSTFLPQFKYMAETEIDTDTILKPHYYAIKTQKLIWLSNKVSMLIGSIRLRQQRVRKGACKINEKGLIKWSVKCVGHFEDTIFTSTKDTNNYSRGWKPLIDLKPSNSTDNGTVEQEKTLRTILDVKEDDKQTILDKTASAWQYVNEKETDSLDYGGYHSWYDGGGYVVNLGYDMRGAKEILEELKKSNWINQRTRALFIEFTTYNPHVQLYNVMIFALEQSSFSTWNHSSRTLANKFHWAGQEPIPPMTITIVIILCCCLLYFCGDAIYNFRKSYKKLGFKGWNYSWLWIDFAIALLGISTVAMFFIAWKEGCTMVAMIDSSPAGEFLNFQRAANLRLNFVYTICFVIVVCYIKLWRFMLFSNRRWFILGFTLRLTRRLVVGFAIYFVILLFAFGSLCHVAFGAYDLKFISFSSALKNLVQVAKVSDGMSYRALMGYHPILGPAFYLLYNFIGHFFYINIVISILTMGLQEARDSASRRSFQHTYLNLIWHKIKALNPLRFSDRRHRDDKEEDRVGLVIVRDAGNIQVDRWYNMKLRAHKFLKRMINTTHELRMRKMKKLAQSCINPRTQIIISKNEKLRKFQKRHMKIKEERLLVMKALTREFVRRKTGNYLTASDMKGYDDYNLQLIQLKYQKLNKQIERLQNLLDHLHGEDEDEPYSNNNN